MILYDRIRYAEILVRFQITTILAGSQPGTPCRQIQLLSRIKILNGQIVREIGLVGVEWVVKKPSFKAGTKDLRSGWRWEWYVVKLKRMCRVLAVIRMYMYMTMSLRNVYIHRFFITEKQLKAFLLLNVCTFRLFVILSYPHYVPINWFVC